MAVRRDHEFTGVSPDWVPTLDDATRLIERLDELNEQQRMRLLEVFDWLETAVDQQVAAELRAEELAARVTVLESAERELQALRSTKLFRAARIPRAVYARIRGRRG
jgi:uncharacterized damage-inducible protein DinB